MNARTYGILCGVLFLLFLSLLAVRINAPWKYHNDDNGAWYTAVARAHVAKGLAQTRGQDHFLSKSSGQLKPYLHHPPFVGLYLAGVFALLRQDNPMVARASTALLHAGSFLLFCGILRFLFPRARALRAWALLVAAVVPMSVFYGKMPNHETPALFFLLGGVYAWLRYTRAGPRRGAWLVVGSLAFGLAVFTSWHAAFWIVGFLVFTAAGGRAGTRRFAAVNGAAFLLALTLVGVHLWWAGQARPLTGQTESVRHWLSVPAGRSVPDYIVWSLIHAFKHGAKFFGLLPCLLSACWLVRVLVLQVGHRRPHPRERVLLGFWVGSFAYSLVFFAAVRVHPYQQFYLLPFVAITSGLLLWRWTRFLSRRAAAATVAAAVLVTIAASAGFLVYLYTQTYAPTIQRVADIQNQYR